MFTIRAKFSECHDNLGDMAPKSPFSAGMQPSATLISGALNNDPHDSPTFIAIGHRVSLDPLSQMVIVQSSRG